VTGNIHGEEEEQGRAPNNGAIPNKRPFNPGRNSYNPGYDR
jgi:hypothetical protein